MNSKHLLLFTFTLSALTVLTQPVIEELNPSVGDAFQLAAFEAAPDPGPAGENITWDFSDLPEGDILQHQIIPVGDALGNELFPDANYATIINTDEVPDPLYFYYRIDQNGWSDYGSYIGTEEFPVAVVFSDPQTAFDLPVTYGSSGTDTYAGEVQSFFDFNFFGTSSYTVDGYGDLILPDGTYSNVLRLSMIRMQEDESFGGLTSNSQSTVHAWISADIPFPLLLIDETESFLIGQSAGIEQSTTYLMSYDGAPTRTSDLESTFNVLPYPNPSEGVFNFHFEYEVRNK